ncbi:hypothetical protein N9045_00175 [bacterium]|nr:hypothetical protein [bacterium]
MTNTPKTQAKPQVSFIVYKGNGGKAEPLAEDLGPSLISLEMQAMANGGYTIRGRFSDLNFNIYNQLIENEYFKFARRQPIKVQFKCKWSNQSEEPDIEKGIPGTATKWIIGYIISMEAVQPELADRNQIEFILIDPPSWYLNVGDASGKCYTGNVGGVIRNVVQDYTPKGPNNEPFLKLDISTTRDSQQGKWWMMRQDPKSFLSSLFDWSASLTPTKTQWVFAPDNYDLVIKPQGLFSSKQRRYYSYHRNKANDPIKQVTLLTDNALSSVQTKLITQGLSTISGQYLDYQTSQRNVEVGDSNTTQKKIARVKKGRAFEKPPKGGDSVGYTSVMTIPEVGSAGDMGLPYKDYIDGRPRSMYLNLVNNLMKAKVTVVGDGEWTGCKGLGIDTIFLDWVRANRSGENDDGSLRYWYTGSWLVYGYCHKISHKSWTTDIYCARYDQDSESVKVGGGKN